MEGPCNESWTPLDGNESWLSEDRYPYCVSNYNCSRKIASYCREAGSGSCKQFCEDFKVVLPFTYMSFSILSAVCCLLVFTTYLCMPRLRKTGVSSKVFLNRWVHCDKRQ